MTYFLHLFLTIPGILVREIQQQVPDVIFLAEGFAIPYKAGVLLVQHHPTV